jgi:putative ABC transport system permease protein
MSSLPVISTRNIMRNKFRAVLTIFALAIAVTFFVLMQTLLEAWKVKVANAAADRLWTWHKVSLGLMLPKRYVDTVRAVPGVQVASYAFWFGGRYERMPDLFFPTIAADAANHLKVFDEIVLSDADKKRFLADRQGAIIGDQLAARTGWKVGDKITLVSSLIPGDWTFNISGINTLSRKTFDRASMMFHWEYLNAGAPEHFKDKVGFIVSKVGSASLGTTISRIIDTTFSIKDIETQTTSELAFNLSFVSIVSSFLTALDAISVIIIAIMLIILANTIGMGVRERTSEYGMMRAIGFLPKHVRRMIIGEAIVLGAVGGAIGLAVAYPLIDLVMAPFLEQNLGYFFAHVWVHTSTAVEAFLMSVLVAPFASAIPAIQAARIPVMDALRKVG